jgi:predicted Zn-dependent protease with MMP-like domain
MESDEFAELVAEALDSLPEVFLEKMENVHVDIEDWPTREELKSVGLSPWDKHSLLGFYHGIPMTDRSVFYMALPDRISIYQGPIEELAGPDVDDIRKQVRRTVIHEIAHYYGIDDDRLEELGWG